MTGMDALDADMIVGHADGLRLGYVEGWAWRPNRPHDKVVVELLVDGAVVAEAAACLYRSDLSTAGIGLGQHAFSIPFTIEADAPPLLHLTVRAKDAAVLIDGELTLETTGEERTERAKRRSLEHLERVFGPFTSGPASPPPEPPVRARPMNFVLHAALAGTALAGTLGMPEYSYVFVMRGYREILRRLGTVHAIREAREADAIYDACMARGESCILLSFAPPQSTPLGLRCPTVPVIAWEYGTIPTGGWPGDPREDWRLVLRQLGRAITISRFAASAVGATMGARFPVAFVPTPVWDRLAGLRARLAASPPALHGRTLTLRPDGHVWDSRAATWSPTMRTPKLPTIYRRAAVAALPMRGAQLALALASQTAQAEARQLAERLADEARQLAERLAAEAQRAEQERLAEAAAAELRAEEAAQRARDLLEQERQAREQAAMELAEAAAAAPLPAPAGALRITAFLARQWYREVVRDALPRPVAAVVSRAGRLAVAMRGRPGEAHSPVQDANPPGDAQSAVEDADPPGDAQSAVQDANPPGEAPSAIEDAAPPVEPPALPQSAEQPAPLAEMSPVDATPAGQDTPAELPVTARYLPVDDAPPPAEPIAVPRYLAAPSDAALPEPSLAVFHPDPRPAKPEPQSSGQQVRIDGTIFAAILSPKDGRKNWQDIMTAFVAAFADTPDATLLIKIIGSDPTYWWWEINGLAKTLPPFACRVVAVSGFLPDEDYQDLIAATHVVVNASLAEGQCLPLVEFMSAGRPAIAPLHTAMLDYITPENAFIVRSDVEFCSWPHDPRNHLLTTRYRIEWPSLRDAYRAAWHAVHDDRARYEAMGRAAAASVAAYCSDAAVAPVLASFLGLDDEALARCGWRPVPRPEAEPALAPMPAERLLATVALP